MPVAAAWANAFAMALTIITVAEPSPAPIRPGAVWTRAHGPQEDADAYIARVGDRWKDAAAAVNAHVVYDPISPAYGVRAYLDREPAGMLAATTRARHGLERVLLGAEAAAIVHTSTVPALVVPLVE